MAHSTARSGSRKPHKDFPLTPRADGRWAKKVRGKVHIFTGTADEALAEWLRVKDDLLAGRTPRATGDGFTVEDLCDHFLNAKRPLVASGELTKRMFDEYFATCERMVKAFGLRRMVDDLRPDDFDAFRAAAAKKWGAHRLGGEVQRARSVFKFGFDAGHIDRPVRLGPGFKKPSKKVMRRVRAEKGVRLFAAAEIHKLIEAASPQLRAMILLGVNCGFGNSDCGQLPIRAIDFATGFIDFPRPKTGINRRCPMWPETAAALKLVLAERNEPKDAAHKPLLFVTKYGGAWFKDAPDNPVTPEFRKLQNRLGLHAPGKGFYALRHTFATIGGEVRDQVAVNALMGHVDGSIADAYRERIDDARLRAVTNHVHRWLFCATQEKD